MKKFILNSSDCNTFELDMISNAYIEGLLKPVSVETYEPEITILIFEEPVDVKRLKTLIDDNYFDLNRYQVFLTKIISLKIRLETYMLTPQNLNFNIEAIWFDPVLNDFKFIYLPRIKKDPQQELNLYRHIIIESSRIIEGNINFLRELKLDSFNLDHFCSLLENPIAIKKSNPFWQRITRSKQQPYTLPESKTIQKSRKACLLDSYNPTIFHEIHFNHNTIGRGDDCNIQINEPSISRRHAIISKNKSVFSLEDLNSSNGTFHNGHSIKDSITLVNGDKLQFGDKEFIFIL